MRKLFLLILCSLFGFTSPMLAMKEDDKGWQHSDQHKLVKGKGGVIMDYSYDQSTSRWILNSECWEDAYNNFYTRCYQQEENWVVVSLFYDLESDITVLKEVKRITFEAYAALDLKKNGTGTQ